MRTAIYARKSTESEERQVQSLDDQIRELTALARREGFDEPAVFQESKSAKEPNNRPEFARLIAEIQAGRVQGVLTWSMDRMSRNPVDGGLVAYLLQTGRLSMIRTVERTYRSDDNALLLSIENGMATAYIQDLRRNVLRGMRGKAERGWHSCKAPIGYLNDAETREIVPDPARFEIVRLAWDTILEGTRTVAEAHRDAMARGLTTARRRGAPQPVSLARFHSMFREPFYAGRLVFEGKEFKGKHRPMVTDEEFATVQEILGDRFRAKEPKRRNLTFAGCLRCARCGCAIVGERREKRYVQSQKVSRYVYYHCSAKKGCSKSSVREEDLHSALDRRLADIELPNGTAGWLSDSVFAAVERGAVETAQDVATLERERARQDTRLRRLASMRLDGEFTAEEHATLRLEIVASLVGIDEKIRTSKDGAERVVRTICQRLEAAVRAGELLGCRRDPLALARAVRVLGGGILNVSTLEIGLDSAIEKIAGFEPLRDGSERPKRGDFLPSNSVWWTLVEELRNLVSEELCCADERERAYRQRYGRYSWRLDHENGNDVHEH